jgi:hypothetical protein
MEPMKPMKPMESEPKWWPHNLGQPSSSGSQNDVRYAFFPDARRLAVKQNGNVTLYDSDDHRINGVSQQQGGSSSLAFNSQKGNVKVDGLKKVTS